MTVNTLNITSGPYSGNGVADTFSYTFRVKDKTQLSVYETNSSGVKTLLVVDTDYTVNDVGVDAGGTILRLAGALPTNYTWYIRSNYIENQLTALPSQGPFFPDVHENQMDHITFLVQQLRDLFGRGFRLADDVDIDGVLAFSHNATARANSYLAFGPTGDLTIASGTADAGLLRGDLASAVPELGASLVRFESGLTVEDLSDTTTDDNTKGFNLVSYPPRAGEVGVVAYQYPYGVSRRYGTVHDGITPDSVAIQNMYTSCAALKIAAKPYPGDTNLITASINVPTFEMGGRNVAVPTFSDAYTVAIYKSTVVGYALVFGTADAIIIDGLQIDTVAGGGIRLGECGGLHLNKFYMNGCNPGYWAIYNDTGTIYTANIDNSRFWREGGYLGRVMYVNAGITIAIRNTFISQQRYNGKIIVIKDTKNFTSDNVQYEGAEETTTLQTFLHFIGNCFNINLRQTYLEGKWNKGVTFDSNATRQFRAIGSYVWNYSKESCEFIDFSTITSGTGTIGSTPRFLVEDINYINNSSVAGTSHIINDPNNVCKITNHFNNSIGNQASRSWIQNLYKESYRSRQKSLGSITSGSTIAMVETLPNLYGEYVFSFVFYNQTKENALAARFRVIFDAGHTANFADSDQLGTSTPKGSNPPTSVAVSVTTAGVVTMTATSNHTGIYTGYFRWERQQLGE